jgi:type II secretion system protein N
VSFPLGRFGIALGCALLTLLFLVIGFPYELAGQRLVASVNQVGGVQLEMDDLGPYLSLAGPGFQARHVSLKVADGTRWQLSRARIRPSWSTSWFRLDPAVHLELDAEMGRIEGDLTTGDTPGFDGVLSNVDLARLPLDSFVPGTDFTGMLDAEIDLQRVDGVVQGLVVFGATRGRLAGDLLPLAIPFESLEGEFSFGGDSMVDVTKFDVQSPLLTAQLAGSVGMASSFAVAPLHLRLELEIKSGMNKILRSAGIRLNRSGKTTLRIEGTVANPEIR